MMLGFRICVFVTVLYAAAALKLQEKQTQEQLPIGTEILNKRLMSNGEKARAFASILPTIIEENEKFQQQGQEQSRQEQQEAAEAATEEEAAVDEGMAPVARDCHEYVDGSWDQTKVEGEDNCAYYYYSFEELNDFYSNTALCLGLGVKAWVLLPLVPFLPRLEPAGS